MEYVYHEGAVIRRDTDGNLQVWHASTQQWAPYNRPGDFFEGRILSEEEAIAKTEGVAA
jgi:hypothetical protein